MNNQESICLLLVEDNPLDVFLFRELLAKLSDTRFQLIHAERVTEGLALLREHPVDMILTDLNLPDASGREAVQRLVAEAAEVPVLALTGQQDKELEGQLLSDGACRVLAKDHLAPSTIADALHHWVRNKDGARS
jgi:CheY-like chemotaxis protein